MANFKSFVNVKVICFCLSRILEAREIEYKQNKLYCYDQLRFKKTDKFDHSFHKYV